MSCLNFCQKCGSNQLLKINDTLTKCQSCHFEIYSNPKPTATTILIHEGKVLLGLRNKAPEKEKWGYGGGFLDWGENAYNCAIREVKEELSIDVLDLIYLTSLEHDYEYKGDLRSINSTVFVGQIDFNQVQSIIPADDVEEVKLVTLDELANHELAFEPFSTLVRERLFAYLGYLPKADLVFLRYQIDLTDNELLRLFGLRMNLVRHAVIYKSNHKLQELNQDRWQQVITDKLKKATKIGLNKEFVRSIWEMIHKETLRIESQIKSKLNK
jgi:ADP-ribose pyrophosphatase YjhB (NUDIX family)/chorismate mutase